MWDTIHTFFRGVVRMRDGRSPAPSVGIIDNQSIKTSAQAREGMGYDGAKRVKVRKRHILVDTLGLLLATHIHPADVQDRDGIGLVCAGLSDQHPVVSTVFADGAYRGPRAAQATPVDLVVVARTKPGFAVLPKRWIVERTFAWLTQNRRLAKDYEGYPATAHRLRPSRDDPPHAEETCSMMCILVPALISSI